MLGRTWLFSIAPGRSQGGEWGGEPNLHYLLSLSPQLPQQHHQINPISEKFLATQILKATNPSDKAHTESLPPGLSM